MAHDSALLVVEYLDQLTALYLDQLKARDLALQKVELLDWPTTLGLYFHLDQMMDHELALQTS